MVRHPGMCELTLTPGRFPLLVQTFLQALVIVAFNIVLLVGLVELVSAVYFRIETGESF